MIGHPNGIHSALVGHGDIFRTHDALEDYLEMGVSLDPFDVLPTQVAFYLMHERTRRVADVAHLKFVAQLVEQLQIDLWLEDSSLVLASLAEYLRVDCYGKGMEVQFLCQSDHIQRVLCVLEEIKLQYFEA